MVSHANAAFWFSMLFYYKILSAAEVTISIMNNNTIQGMYTYVHYNAIHFFI